MSNEGEHYLSYNSPRWAATGCRRSCEEEAREDVVGPTTTTQEEGRKKEKKREECHAACFKRAREGREEVRSSHRRSDDVSQ